MFRLHVPYVPLTGSARVDRIDLSRRHSWHEILLGRSFLGTVVLTICRRTKAAWPRFTHLRHNSEDKSTPVIDHIDQSVTRIDRSTILGYDRTRLAYQRTLLSWVRTATALITFGFAIYNFHRIVTGDRSRSRLIGPHEFALIMVVIGLVALLLAMIEYRRDIRALAAQYPDIPCSPLPGAVALLVSVLGLVVLIVIVFRL
jgi:putative membrane protein